MAVTQQEIEHRLWEPPTSCGWRCPATQLRHQAGQDQYAGLGHPAKAFGLTLLLDEMRMHLRTVPDETRDVVVKQCRVIGTDEKGERSEPVS